MSNLAVKVQQHRRDLASATFAQDAAPEVIAVHLDDAVAARRQLDMYVDWLQNLAGRRAAQIEAGTWPLAAERAS